MTLFLGIDTGGTYTDAVLYDPAAGVVAAAKALTTRHDLAEGVGAAIAAVLSRARADISLVSLSTTLATNALVEGQGSAAALLLIGYDQGALGRAGLGHALKGDPVAFLAGGHGPLGDEQEPLDMAAAEAAIQRFAPTVSAFAVAGYFGVRNPAHELRVRERARALTGLPVTCAHELSHHLDAPRRALTALLNARLVPLIDRLVRAVERRLTELGVRAPLMVVKGDGALIAASDALNRPVETILSGPAASVVGAVALTGEQDVFVSDMGGTTTDIALIAGGKPVLNRDGAVVGGWRTMVEAVAVHTVGIGGDSEVWIDAKSGLVVGPRRVMPLSLLAHQRREVLAVLRAQAGEDAIGPLHGRFALRARPLASEAGALSPAEHRVWEMVGEGPAPLTELLASRRPERPLRRLIERGLLTLASFTPTDAAHILGRHRDWSVEAARIGGGLWCRRAPEPGWTGARDAESFAETVLELVTAETVRAIMEAAIDAAAGLDAAHPEPLADLLLERAASRPPTADGLFQVSVTLGRPLVAIGAPVGTFYPEVAQRLRTRLVLPPHHGVANAVGAVAGGILETATATVTAPREDRFRVHGPHGIADFGALEAAALHAEAEVRRTARARAEAAGAETIEVTVERNDTVVRNFGADLFIESRITATATGRPRLAG